MQPFERFGIEIGKDNLTEGAIYGVASVYLTIEKLISDYLRPFAMSPAKFNALMVLKHKGGKKGLSQADIGRHLIVTASNMTRLLDRLHQEGLIERFAQEGDRRVNLIKITQKGSGILDRVWPGYHKKLAEIAAHVPHEDLRGLSDLLINWFVRLEKPSR
ncbi:MAG: MarR family transcriptional regulator [Candidatus Omnitrophota bacterium]